MTAKNAAPKSPTVYTNVHLNQEQLDMFNRKRMLLAEIAKIDATFDSAGIVFTTNPMYKWVDNFFSSIDNKLATSKAVISASASVLGAACRSILALQEITRHTVRLYSLEGRHLSRKDGEQTRMTWYMNPMEAIEIGEYMGGLTGRLVYVDLELDFCSDYSFTWNKLNQHIYTLKGDLMKSAKRKWKYVPSNLAQVAVTTEI